MTTPLTRLLSSLTCVAREASRSGNRRFNDSPPTDLRYSSDAFQVTSEPPMANEMVKQLRSGQAPGAVSGPDNIRTGRHAGSTYGRGYAATSRAARRPCDRSESTGGALGERSLSTKQTRLRTSLLLGSATRTRLVVRGALERGLEQPLWERP